MIDALRTRGASRAMLVLAVVALLLVGGLALRAGAARSPHVPKDTGFENRTGVRVTRVAVVGDGGLLDVRYVVLDEQKATKWFGDTTLPPRVKNTKRTKQLFRVAAMRQGHELRTGQTYYLIYLNTGGKTKRGDVIDVSAAGDSLAGVPVE